ncbi:MAG: hypothetical protein QGF07_06030 [Phycisphaerales bacterium]|jgi:hypothetical protein|nr:hypothetical protein [Phycisphaerales bacterium]|tara:strand:- start:1409 stop:1939 length:531 start_codon:yes stop_codon:yes gene_type:complete
MFESESTRAKVHPIDPRELTFGSIISPEQIESAYRVSRDDYKDYNLARMQMRGFIEQTLPDVLGTRVFVKNCKDGLRVLLATEVADEMKKRNQKAVRSIRKSCDVGSDTSQLPDLTSEQRQEITSQLNISSVMTQAYLRGLKKEKLLPKPCSESMLPENLSSETHLIDEEIEEIDI